VLLEPWSQQTGVMISGIVQDDYQFAAPTPPGDQRFEKVKKALGTKFLGALAAEASVGGANGPEYGNTFASGSMQDDRVDLLRRHPHHATRAMLLEMTFVLKPEVQIVSFGQADQFFYIAPVAPDRLWRSTAGVCATETLTDETAAGIDGGPL
jgi:hypothetical protein